MTSVEIRIDTSLDAAYIRLSGKGVASTSVFDDAFVVDLDEYGMVVGIEVLDLSEALPIGRLAKSYHIAEDVADLLRRVRPSIMRLMATSSPARPAESAVRAIGNSFSKSIAC